MCKAWGRVALIRSYGVSSEMEPFLFSMESGRGADIGGIKSNHGYL